MSIRAEEADQQVPPPVPDFADEPSQPRDELGRFAANDNSDEPAPEAAAPIRKSPHDRRRDVMRAAQAMRRGEDLAEPEPPADTDLELGTFQPTKTPSNDNAQAIEEQDVESRAPLKRKLKVDHREIEVTDEEMEGYARQHLAAENRLGELNNLRSRTAAELAELQRLRQSHAQQGESTAPQRQQNPATERSRETPPRAREEIDFKAAAEKLQLGDAEEAAETLRNLFLQAQNPQAQAPQVSPEEIAARVRAQFRQDADSDAAIHQFAERHPAIANDIGLQNLSVTAAHMLMLDEMKSVGVQDHHIQAALQNPRVAQTYHRNLVAQGYQLSDPRQIMEKAAEAVERKYAMPAVRAQNQPAPSGRTETRDAEKRQIVQPRRANVVARQPGPPAPRTKTETVQAMRQARGYRTY